MNLSALTDLAATLVDQVIPDCEGACLGTSALLAHILTTHGTPTTAVRGEYDEHPHWWLETDTHRIDATRTQFHDGQPLVEPLNSGSNETPYLPDARFPARWTREQAITEFARMFELGHVGEMHGQRILHELEMTAPMLQRSTVLTGKEA